MGTSFSFEVNEDLVRVAVGRARQVDSLHFLQVTCEQMDLLVALYQPGFGFFLLFFLLFSV